MINKQHIAENLRLLRTWRGFSQEYVAEYLDISRVTYNNYETCKACITAEKLEALASLYGIPVSFILHSEMGDENFCPYTVVMRDDLAGVAEKYASLTFINKLLVMERIRTLIEVEASLYRDW